MAKNKQIHFKMHGLKKDTDDLVSPGAFGSKLVQLEKTLKLMDESANGESGFNYGIKDLKIGSVEVVLEEFPYPPLLRPQRSGIEEFNNFAAKVSSGDSALFDISHKVMLENLKDLCKGVGKNFSYAELDIQGKNSTKIIIDETFQSKAKQTVVEIEKKLPLFKGITYETHIGHLKEVDLRNEIPKAKLILFVNRIELPCICKSISIKTLCDSLNKAVSVLAKAKYDGIYRLPKSLDLVSIEIFREPGKLSDWKGKFDIPYPNRKEVI